MADDAMFDRWVWVDVETTGLDPEVDELLEVAFVITDFDLNELTHFQSLVYCSEAGDKCKRSGDVVVQMHRKSGLLVEVARLVTGSDGTPKRTQLQARMEARREWTPGAVQKRVQAFFAKHFPPGSVGPMCGSTPSFDRSMLKKYMPEIEARFSHRHIDVSTPNELARQWRPKLKEYTKALRQERHRALDDIRESIDLLRFYRAAKMVG